MTNTLDKFIEQIKTKISCLIIFFRKSGYLWDNVKKYILERDRPQLTVWRTSIACWVPKATTHTICNIYCFSTATMVMRTRLAVTFIRRLPCLYFWQTSPNVALLENCPGSLHTKKDSCSTPGTCTRICVIRRWSFGIDGSGFRIPVEIRDLSLFRKVHTNSGAHPALCLMCTEVPFWG